MPETNLLPLFFIGTAVLTTFAAVTVIVLILARQRQARARAERERMTQAYNEALLRTKIEVQERALASVAREIHDGVKQELGAARLAFASLRPHISTTAATEALRGGLEGLTAAIGNLRLLSHSLHSGVIHQRGLEASLHIEINRLAALTSLHCTFTTGGEPQDISPEAELFIFRIAQESFENIVKHAGATTIDVLLEWSEGSGLRLRIADNGNGIDFSAGDGAGLINMRERAEMIGGCLRILPAAAGGTEVILSIPENAILHGREAAENSHSAG